MASLVGWFARVGRSLDAMRQDLSRPVAQWTRTHRVAAAFASASLLSVVAFDAWLMTCGFAGCPSPAAMEAYRPSEGGRVEDRHGALIGRLHPVNRVNVPLARVPVHVRQAFIATEDRRFLDHAGVDWRGFARSVVRNVQSLGVREGFSTITMQAARNAWLSEEAALRRSVGRKLIELRLAHLMEQRLSKNRILELYLNEIYLGNGVYGVEAASRDLFGKSVREVNVAEGALLAALPKGPSAYTPKRHADRARVRRDLVLGLMHEQGYLKASARERAVAAPLRIRQNDWRAPQTDESAALDLVRTVADSLLRDRAIPEGELIIRTTLDLAAQRAAVRAVRQHAARIEQQVGWWNRPSDRLQGAMVAIDPRTGDVRAMVGGRDHERTGFNRAVDGRRQPGSAFKPFVYAAAIMSGYTPATMVDDEPISVSVGNDVWSPENYGQEYRGPVTLRSALAHSANAATVRVSRAVGERRVVEVAHNNGIASTIRAVPAVALGAVEVSPLELVTAYAPFANGGFRVSPRLIASITRRNGEVVYSAQRERESVMDPRDAWQVTSMLRAVVDEGTGRVVRGMGVTGQVAGKTGTTNDGTDVWFVGYTPNVVAGFWFGFDQPRPMGEGINGGRHAAPAWADFYQNGWREREGRWSLPQGLVAVDIDPETGQLADEWCPTRRTEYFRPGTEPSTPCQGDHGVTLMDEVMDSWEDGNWQRPLSRALRRLMERER